MRAFLWWRVPVSEIQRDRLEVNDGGCGMVARVVTSRSGGGRGGTTPRAAPAVSGRTIIWFGGTEPPADRVNHELDDG